MNFRQGESRFGAPTGVVPENCQQIHDSAPRAAIAETLGNFHTQPCGRARWATHPQQIRRLSRNGADRSGERHAPARGRARFSRANRVECHAFFEVPYMSHRERTAWLRLQSNTNRSPYLPNREIYRDLAVLGFYSAASASHLGGNSRG